MDKVKILLIAPYKGLYEMANSLKYERDDVLIDVENGNLSEGAQIAERLQYNGYDAIVSRGGTTLEIKRVVELPVIDIEFTAYDMMRILRMTDCMSAKEAIVGYPSIAKCAKIVSELMNRDICVKTIDNEDEAREVMKQLRDQGFNIIIGDQIVHNIAMKQNMNSILFLSGPESLNQSIDEAVKISKLNRRKNKQIKYLEKLLCLSKEKIYAIDEDRQLFYNDWDVTDKTFEHFKEITEAEMDEVSNILWETENEFVWKVRKYQVNENEIRITACYAEKYCADTGTTEESIQIKSVDSMPEMFYYKYYGQDEEMKQLSEDVSDYGRTLLPILLIGEQGTGKTNMAYAMHKESAKRSQLFAEISCERLCLREFERIFTKYKDILYSKDGGTVYFDNIDKMPEETQKHVLAYLSTPAIVKNFRFIFSATSNIEERVRRGAFHKKLAKIISELVLSVPPLRDRPSCIEEIAGMIIHELNMKHGKNVIGFDAVAREKLRQYYWPGNITQLYRVISELILRCTSARISAAALNNKINQERFVSYPQPFDLGLNLKQPLDNIIDDIIQIVMKEENMNQTKVTERLGISRSTLWRRLSNQ